jgi:hypothetical protein
LLTARDLLPHIPADIAGTCDSTSAAGTLVALSCPGSNVDVTYLLYQDKVSMDAQFNQEANHYAPKAGDCGDPLAWPATGGWSIGAVREGGLSCDQAGATTIRWTDDRYLVFAYATGHAGVTKEELYAAFKDGLLGLN